MKTFQEFAIWILFHIFHTDRALFYQVRGQHTFRHIRAYLPYFNFRRQHLRHLFTRTVFIFTNFVISDGHRELITFAALVVITLSFKHIAWFGQHMKSWACLTVRICCILKEMEILMIFKLILRNVFVAFWAFSSAVYNFIFVCGKILKCGGVRMGLVLLTGINTWMII